ncbi:MAG TPA: biotin-dependent carboxyltransferase family protein [Mycobacteriales bacterium]|nr:biotin-dependent carboxyltransferase family protein [Mycobacteriales bacterium]
MIEVLAPGSLTTVQDAGRFGWRHVGVPVAGPADWLSHALANRLVGNDDGAAALELTLTGPRLRFGAAATVAVLGATAALDGEPLPADASFRVPAGAELAVGPAGPGVRGYVAVAGGLAVPPVLGSRSTDTLAGLGPPPLAVGAILPASTVDCPLRTVRWAALPAPRARAGEPLRVVPGPHEDWFTVEALHTLCSAAYVVTPASDRVGARLSGPGLARGRPGELPVTGMVAGALQVPPDGQPILLLANHGPTGGYPIVGVLATADLPAAGQARPGDPLRFAAVSRDAAARADAELRAALAAAVIPVG